MRRFLSVNLFLIFVAAPMAMQAGDISMTSRRIAALVPLAIGLISVAVGRYALRAATRNGSGKQWSVIAVVAALIGVFASVRHLVGSDNLGTGSGRLGAAIALIVSLIGIVIGGYAFARAVRRRP